VRRLLISLVVLLVPVALARYFASPDVQDVVLWFCAFVVLGLLVTAPPLISRMPDYRVVRRDSTAPPVNSVVRVRLANALVAGKVDCDEAYLDCAKLVVTNDGPDIEVAVGLRADGAAPVEWLLRDGSRERTFTIHKDESVYVPLFVRTRQPIPWNTHQPHGNTTILSPGPCYIFDEKFQLSGTPNLILKPGRHYLAIDVHPKGQRPVTVTYNLFVPTAPQKSLWTEGA
jgi:hypothetical protein